ncbi:uncharacterized protein I303_101391 [Kwoniella dejecticola CBS 10117]|uniref:Coiled-coil domain-containing protein 43 n=1 Tax=Kwoniella dejecticola CBS 10117 TaxID=1296121 RepID=A0A1A6AHM3_9TREE|nr:uncharacterized protein I303_01400 [Kwoniella dejecticola CBS 10117]OBR89572.1 hypothetical protein I303_01400 [Kwoniella dejecticola CBS 10117]
MSTAPDEAESSAQALERYIAEQLTGLSISVPQDDVEMMARFVEEEGLERDEKLEGVKGMLEGVVEGGVLPEEGVDEALEKVLNEQERLRIAEQERLRAEEEEEDDSPSPPTKPSDILSTLSPEELKQAQKAALLRQYAYVDASADEVQAAIAANSRDPNAPARAGKASESEEKKAAEERKKMIEEALRLDGKKKKYRKQQEVDLLAPNLNRDKVAYRAQMEREAQKNAALAVKNRDKAALEKQRADQAKAKADKQKKAAKQERRG